MLQVHSNRMCMRISFFRFENGPGNKSFFSVHDQNTAETSHPQTQAPFTRRRCENDTERSCLDRKSCALPRAGLVRRLENRAEKFAWVRNPTRMKPGYTFLLWIYKLSPQNKSSFSKFKKGKRDTKL